MGAIRLTYLIGDEIEKLSPIYLPLLKRIEKLCAGRWSIDRCYADILSGDLIVWLVIDGDKTIAAFTVRVCQSSVKYLVLEDVGGERVCEWAHLVVEKTEQFARAIGCSQITMSGRLGWKKYFKKHGFKPYRIDAVKMLEGSHE